MLSGSQGCSDEHTCQAVPDYWLRATMPITGFTSHEGGLSQEATSNQASGSFAHMQSSNVILRFSSRRFTGIGSV